MAIIYFVLGHVSMFAIAILLMRRVDQLEWEKHPRYLDGYKKGLQDGRKGLGPCD